MTDAQTNYIGQVDFSNLYFAPIAVDKTRKSVSVYYNKKNTTWANRMVFQICEDEDSPVIAKYGLQEPKGDEDPTRRNLPVLLDSTAHKAVIDKLHELDNIVKQEAVKKSKEWWKKELSEDAIEHKYKPIIEWDPDRDCYKVKVKIIVPHPNPDPNKKYSKPTKLYRMTSDGNAVGTEDHTILNADSKLVPIVSSMGVWFMGENQFGISLKADTIICTPGVTRTPLEQFKLKRKIKEVEPEDPSSSNDNKAPKIEGDEVPDGGDEDGSAM